MLRNILQRVRFGYWVAFNVVISVFLTLFVVATVMNVITGFKLYVLMTNLVILLFTLPVLIRWLHGVTSQT